MEKFVTIRELKLPRTACLAPMAGVADRAFRELCVEWGACYTVGEMASSKGLLYGDKKTEQLLMVTEKERPMAVQLFGEDVSAMTAAVKSAMKYAPDVIDINMGCPVLKVTGTGAGSALMKNPQLAGEIVEKMRKETDLPLTVKFRKGWNDEEVNAVEFAKIMEQAGADAIAVHGRTRKQMYAPPVDLDIIAKVKRAVNIPVIGNGDVVDGKSAIEMYEKTGCDLVMVGRGALGCPWIFKEISYYMETGTQLPPPTLEQKMEVMLEQIAKAVAYKGEYVALKEARKHCGWYLKGMRGAAAYRKYCSELSTMDDIKRLVSVILKENKEISLAIEEKEEDNDNRL